MPANEDLINRWSEVAPFWEKYREVIQRMFGPVAAALNEDALIGAGSCVLDVATGPGEPALTIASLVASTGTVYGIDPVPEMVDAARRAAHRLGLKNAHFDVAFADHLPFPSETFDSVVSRFGVMFFPSPVDAVREMLRVLKPGKKLALAAWYLAEENPFFYLLSRILDRYVEPTTPAPGAPDPFRFAGLGELRQVLDRAGALSSSERILQFVIEAPISAEEFWTLRCEMSDTLRKRIAMLSTEQLAEVKRQALEAFCTHSTEQGLSFPAKVLIVSGTKSSGVARAPAAR